jgi:D-alanine-D-alanine ligase
MRRVAPDWWRHYFDQTWYRLHAPLFPEAQTRREVAGMIELLGVPLGAAVLDAPCGWGRHAALLAAAGYDVTGADLSPAMLSRASARAPRTAWVAADLRALPFDDNTFAAVLNVFTSLGLFHDAADDRAALAEAYRVLAPGGVFLLESMHRDEVVATYVERDAWTLPDGTEVAVRRHFDPIAGISYERMRWNHGAQRGEKRMALRLRTATEMAQLLLSAGFCNSRYWGDWDGAPFTHRAERFIAVSRKA